MHSIKESESLSSCGPDCSCNPKKGLSIQVKLILLAIIILGAGAVLTASLIKKSHMAAATKPSTGYAVSAFQTQSPLAPSIVKKDTSGSSVDDTQLVSFKPLASISALNDVAQHDDGVFILLVKNEADKTPNLVKEITETKKAIATRGIRMGTFQLAGNAPEFAVFSAQLPPPGVVVIVKGKSMRGVQGADINKTKLLQAFIAASQASSCCSSGGNRVCK